jgi:hypothetical protein
METFHRFRGSLFLSGRDNVYYYLSEDESCVMSLDSDTLEKRILLNFTQIDGEYYLFDQDIFFGVYRDRIYSYLEIRGQGNADLRSLEQNGILFRTFPEWTFRHGTGNEHFYARDNRFFHPLRGHLTPYIPVFTEYWDPDGPDGLFLGFIDTVRGEVVSVSRRGPEHHYRVSPLIRYRDRYYCIWNTSFAGNWLMIFDGREGRLIRTYDLSSDYSELSSWSFSGDMLWIHRAFDYGYIVLDTGTGDIVLTSEKNEYAEDVTSQVTDYLYKEVNSFE